MRHVPLELVNLKRLHIWCADWLINELWILSFKVLMCCITAWSLWSYLCWQVGCLKIRNELLNVIETFRIIYRVLTFNFTKRWSWFQSWVWNFIFERFHWIEPVKFGVFIGLSPVFNRATNPYKGSRNKTDKIHNVSRF